MSAFGTTPSEYLDITICMLMDAVRHGKDFETNERWTNFIVRGALLGLKAIIYPLYLTTDIDARIKYKMLAPVLKGSGTCYIHIKQTTDNETVDSLPSPKGVNKDIVKKIFRKVKQVRMKTSMPITEERLDKIIDYVVKQEEQNG